MAERLHQRQRLSRSLSPPPRYLMSGIQRASDKAGEDSIVAPVSIRKPAAPRRRHVEEPKDSPDRSGYHISCRSVGGGALQPHLPVAKASVASWSPGSSAQRSRDAFHQDEDDESPRDPREEVEEAAAMLSLQQLPHQAPDHHQPLDNFYQLAAERWASAYSSPPKWLLKDRNGSGGVDQKPRQHIGGGTLADDGGSGSGVHAQVSSLSSVASSETSSHHHHLGRGPFSGHRTAGGASGSRCMWLGNASVDGGGHR